MKYECSCCDSEATRVEHCLTSRGNLFTMQLYCDDCAEGKDTHPLSGACPTPAPKWRLGWLRYLVGVLIFLPALVIAFTALTLRLLVECWRMGWTSIDQ